MSLTFQQIWERYSHVEFRRRLYVKRLKVDGTYESDFSEISAGLTQDGSVQALKRSLPNNSWKFGYVTVGNVQLQILSAYQEFSSENDRNSIFFGFIRHNSIIRVVDSFVDKYTDRDNPTEASVITFEGLIDSTTATTEQGFEKVTLLDFLSILSNINVSELMLSETTMNNLVYEIVNRPEFTKYFNVSNSSTYINAGYNATNIDTSVYKGSVLAMLEDLSKGHSIFFIDSTDNYFYFKQAIPTDTAVYSFLESNNRKLDISSYREGVDRQITNWYWDNKDVDISAVADPAPVNVIQSNFKIDGITNNTQRQNVLNYVLNLTSRAKPYFKLQLPYFPIIKLLDRVIVQSFGSAPKNAARWGMFLWTASNTTNPNAAPRWFKPAGIRISANEEWMVRSISHDANLKTVIELEKIL